MEKILSVAIPAFNAEKYLEKCLSSFLVEEVLDKLDIIIVNDGSTDQTGAIANRYVHQWPKTFSVIHQQNGGHGSGINAAAKVAVGKYFRVVDADDWVITGNLFEHVQELEAVEADVVINGFHRVDMNSGKKQPILLPKAVHACLMSIDEVAERLATVRHCFSIQGITYNRRLYLATNLQLSEGIFYEDSEYITLPFAHVCRVFFSPHILYQYLVGNADQSISNNNQVRRLPDLEKTLKKVCTEYHRIPLTRAAQSYFEEKIRGMLVTYFITCLLRDPERVAGFNKARNMLIWLENNTPAAFEVAKHQFKKILLLHQLHISGTMLDSIRGSSLYHRIRDQLKKS